MTKIIFSDKINKTYYGTCRKADRNRQSEIIIYKNCKDNIDTVIHETIHNFLFEKANQGFMTRALNKISLNEQFVKELTTEIMQGIKAVEEHNKKCKS